MQRRERLLNWWNIPLKMDEPIFLESKPTFSLDDENNLQAKIYANGNYTTKVNDAEDWTIKVIDIPSQVEIKGNWQINFRGENFYEATIKTDELFDWTAHKAEQIKHYSGTAIYTTTFNIEKGMLQSERKFKLNLGEVSVIAKVILNGKDIGVSWIAPHALQITDAIKEGENTLEIQVTNQWTNRLIGDEKLPNQSGLLGPVTISTSKIIKRK